MSRRRSTLPTNRSDVARPMFRPEAPADHEVRLRVRLRVRFKGRSRVRLRVPPHSASSYQNSCKRASFSALAVCDISMLPVPPTSVLAACAHLWGRRHLPAVRVVASRRFLRSPLAERPISASDDASERSARSRAPLARSAPLLQVEDRFGQLGNGPWRWRIAGLGGRGRSADRTVCHVYEATAAATAKPVISRTSPAEARPVEMPRAGLLYAASVLAVIIRSRPSAETSTTA